MVRCDIFSDGNLRMWVIPVLMGAVWVLSFAVSFLYDPADNSRLGLIARLFVAFNLCLLFEMLLMFWDMQLLLKGYSLHRNHSFILQCRTVPFFILAGPLGILALSGGCWLWVYIGLLFTMKTGMHHSAVYVDRHRGVIEYDIPQPV